MRSHIITAGLAIGVLLSAPSAIVASIDPHLSPSIQDVDTAIKSLNIGVRDRRAIFGDTTIIKRLRVTDCHSSLSRQLESRCLSGQEGVDLGEGYRSEVAISLTLCSLSSAMQTIPSDCEAWYRRGGDASSENSPSWRVWRSARDTRSASARAACLGSLHRSPQDWTSYNQYLSDATLLCSALKADEQMERAQELYANATMEKISLISLLKTNEADRKVVSDRLFHNMDMGTKDVRKNAEAMSHTLENIRDEMQRQALARSEMMREMQQMLQLMNAAGIGAWDEVRSQGSDVVETLATDIQRSYDDLATQLQDQLHQLLSGLATEHGSDFAVQRQHLVSETEMMVSKLSERFTSMSGDIQDHLTVFHERISATAAEASALQQGVYSAAVAIREIHPLLLASVDAAVEIQDNHNQTLAALVESREAASSMLEKLDRSLEIIKESSGLTQEAMTRRRWSFMAPSLFSVSAVNLSDSSSISAGVLRTVLDLIYGLLQLLCTTVGLMCYMAFTVFITLRSCASGPIKRAYQAIKSELESLPEGVSDAEKQLSSICPRVPRVLQPTASPPARRNDIALKASTGHVASYHPISQQRHGKIGRMPRSRCGSAPP